MDMQIFNLFNNVQYGVSTLSIWTFRISYDTLNNYFLLMG